MAKIRGKDTKPELLVRRLLHAAGYRYRVHCYGLPGRPDLVFTARRKVVFVHGCFWHYHVGCKVAHIPKSRRFYWKRKLEARRTRDTKNIELLTEAGWDSTVIWECEVKDTGTILRRLTSFLGPAKNPPGVDRESD